MLSDNERLAEATGRPRITGLDALRGLAALSVVLFHYTYYIGTLYGLPTPPIRFKWGFFGVELFFLISGYVIFMTLTRIRRPADFLVSRFSRLYPAYWAAVIFTFTVVYLFGLPGREVSAPNAILNLTMLQTFLLRPSVDGVYWTLAVELAFYAIAFALFLAGMLRPRRLPVALGAWLLLGVAWKLFITHGPHVPAVGHVGLRLMIFPHAQFFVAGMCLFEIKRSGRASWPLVLLVAATPIAAFIQDPITGGPATALQTALVTLGLLVLFIAVVNGRVPWLATRPLLELGAISYTLYLVHDNFGFVMLRWLYSRDLDPLVAVPLTIIAALLLAVLITRLIEQPAMRWIRGRYRRRHERAAAVPIHIRR